MLFIVLQHLGERTICGLPIALMPHHVDCFILISGYFLITAEFKFERVLRTAIETIFYSFTITLILFLLGKATSYELVKSVVVFGPTMFNYWFVTKYVALLLLSPFITSLALNITKRQYQVLLFTMVMLNTTLFIFFPLGGLFANGVSLQWMITLFLTSGYLRLYPLEISRWFSFMGMCLCLVVYNLCSHYFSDIVILDYNSLVTYCLAIFTFLWFKDWQLSNTNLFAKIVLFISSNIFAVYLIHEQWYLRTKYVVEWFNLFVGVMPNWLYLFVFGFMVIIVCVLIDKGRVWLFKLLKLDLFIANLGKSIDKFYI
jgi:hypothetical protein